MIRCAMMIMSVVLLSAAGRTQEAAAPHPLQPSEISTPAATLNSLVDSCNELHSLIVEGTFVRQREAEVLAASERILDCLDLSELPTDLRSTAGIQSAIFLKEVLDRIELPKDAEIPDLSGDATASVVRWQIPGTRLAISRAVQGPHLGTCRFTPETVRRAAEFYRMVKNLPYRSEGRKVSPDLHDAYTAATRQQPTQTSDTSSPRGTLTLFLDTCNELHKAIQSERYFNRNDPEYHRLGQQIISCLDTSQLPDYSREYYDAEAAMCLKEVLDRIPLPPAEQIPGIESVEATDGGEAIVRWQVPRTQISISKMQDGPRRGEFLFSANTVARATEFYEKVRKQPYRADEPAVSKGFHKWWLSVPGDPTVAALVDRLPRAFQQRYYGMAIWQWIGLILAVPVSISLMGLLLFWGRQRGQRFVDKSLLQYWLSFVFLIAAIFVPIAFKYFAWEYLTLRGSSSYILNFCCDLVFLLGIMVLIVGGSSRAAESVIAFPQISPQGLDANLIRIIFRVLGIVAAVVVFLEGGRYLGFPITTLIASAGIGGLAIALSAQGLMKGLFGTVTVLLDKPYRVGERIAVKGHDGIVEEIGLRSTKIRAFSNHLISIPNDQMADAEIENIGKRKHIRRSTDLHIPLDTPLAKLEEAVSCIRSILKDHEGADPAFPPRVYFTEFNPDSFNIRIIYWYMPPDLWKYYTFSESVNLQIMKTFEERGIQFSLPFRHSYWKRDAQQGPLEVTLIDGQQAKIQSASPED